MLPFTISGDYDISVTHEEVAAIKTAGSSGIEATLLLSGEVPTDKNLKLVYVGSAKERVGIKYHPENVGWDEMKKVELIVNDDAWWQLYLHGAICGSWSYGEIHIRKFGALGNSYPIDIPEERRVMEP
jgi:hypothetical protein